MKQPWNYIVEYPSKLYPWQFKIKIQFKWIIDGLGLGKLIGLIMYTSKLSSSSSQTDLFVRVASNNFIMTTTYRSDYIKLEFTKYKYL